MTSRPPSENSVFPFEIGRIIALCASNPEFARLWQSYDWLSGRLRRARSGEEPLDDAAQQVLIRDQSDIRDEIARLLGDN